MGSWLSQEATWESGFPGGTPLPTQGTSSVLDVTIFKVFTELVTILLLFSVLVFVLEVWVLAL